MATLLDATKAPNSAKVEEFVNRQLKAARRRVRVLDFFAAGLVVAITTLVFLLIVQFIDRAYETPPKIGYLVWGVYGALAVGYLYWSVFRPSRREINPYYAARELELNVDTAKNSLVTWVDLEDDQKLPPSIRAAISQKAAKDLKGLDLNQAIENKTLLWVGIAAAVLLIGNAIVAFLPPTRTALTLEEPANGNVTVFNNQDVKFQVRVRGRIPQPNSGESVRLRLWYNPEDPETFEERPLTVSETDKRQFELTIPPRQVRMGFRYRILAGNTQTPEYTVTCKIIPEFTGFDVNYEYPTYLKRPAEQNNDPNLLAPYASTATLIVHTNRDVKNGHIEIDGQARTIDGQLIEGQTDSIKFAVPFEKESQYRVWFTTTEGDKNSDPKRFRLAVIDPKPVFRTFDISYEYPAYLRWKPATGTDIREPEIEAIRGSVVTLTAKTNRGVKSAQLQLEGLPPIIGTSVPDEPMWVRFKLPPIDKDGTAKVSFAPGTPENPTLPKAIPVRAIIDQPPTVQLQTPTTDEITLPANGTLELKGFATDDHGIDGMTLQMKLVGAGDLSLDGKPYRNGISFLRKEDNSWPIRVDYKDFVKLPDIRMPNNPNFRIAQGSTVEFWVEARDNCTVPPGPNVGRSNAKRFKVIAPVQAPAEKAKVENRNQELNKEQKNHNEKQDKQLQGEQRPQNQPPVKGQNPPEPKNDGNPQDNPMPMGGQPQGNPMPKNGNPMPKDGDPMPGGMNPDNTGNNPMPMPKEGMNPDPNQDQQNQEIERAAKESENAKKEGKQKPDSRPDPNAKVEPSEQRPAPKNDPNGEPPADQKPMPKNDPNQNMGDNAPAGEKRDGKVDKTKEDKSENKPGGDKPMDMNDESKDKEALGGSGGGDSKQKPEPKQPAGKEPPPEKGGARPEQSPEQKGMNPDQKPQTGANKPEKEVTQGEEKQPAPKEGMGGSGEKDQPDQTAGSDKPKERPGAGEGRPQSKKSGPMEETAGEKRPQPKSGGPEAGENRPEPKHDMGDETAKSEGKPQPGQGQPNGEKNELDRETAGELDREVNSPKPEISDKGKSDVERLMRNKETRQKTRDELDKLEKNAKDQLSRKKAQDLKKAGEEAAKNYDQEKPTEEKVDELAKKLNSKDQQEQKDAEQRLKDWQKDQQTKKDLEKEVDQLKKKKPEEGKKVEQAMNKPNPKKDDEPGQSGDTPKPDEQKLNEMAKDLQSNDPMKREQAQKQLEQMMNDPKNRDQAKDKLNEMAKNANNPDDKKNLENAAQKANDMAKANGQKQEKDLKDIADKMAGKNEQDKKDAENKLNEMMKDPAKAEEAKKQLQDMANNSKNPDDKKKLEDAAKKADDMAKANGQKQEQDLKDIADKMAGKDEQAKKDAENKLNEMMKDPAKAEAAKKKMEEMAKNAKNADDKKNMEDAAKKADEMAKANGNKPEPKTDPKDLKEMADKLAGKEGEAKKKEAEDKLKNMMKDPAKAEEAKKKMEEMAKNASKDDEKKALEEMLKQANEMAKNPPKADPKDLKDLKDLMDKMKKTDPKEHEEAKEKLKEAMKDPKIREQMEKLKEQMAKNQEDPAKQKEFADIMKELGGGNPEDNGKPDPADPRNKLKAAELMLDKFKKNLTDDEFNQSLKWTEDQKAEWIRKQEATIAELKKQAEKGDWNTNRMVRPTTDKGPASVKFDPKSGVDPLRGGRYAPPAGYADPYKKFTEEASGVKSSIPAK
ncbi:hypothetical protein [Zavarzinella formosa]|uniref:hypothetical protein n=1 Tax=Zavarzinella formosa TaxID=360055 RepID=UPI0002F1B346|nr:hypothetical protein [Zavarzinella formosa]